MSNIVLSNDSKTSSQLIKMKKLSLFQSLTDEERATLNKKLSYEERILLRLVKKED